MTYHSLKPKDDLMNDISDNKGCLSIKTDHISESLRSGKISTDFFRA